MLVETSIQAGLPSSSIPPGANVTDREGKGGASCAIAEPAVSSGENAAKKPMRTDVTDLM
jgi:hypothetical protein